MKEAGSAGAGGGSRSEPPTSRWQMSEDLVSGTVLLALAVVYGAGAFRLVGSGGAGPALMPIGLAGALLLLSGRIAVSGWRRRSQGSRPSADSKRPESRGPASGILATAAYALLFIPLGFAVSTMAYTAVIAHLFRAGTRARWLLPPVVTLLIYAFFRTALGVRLPLGPFG